MAPVMPFFCEYLFQRLMVDTGLAPNASSVHLSDFPKHDESLFADDLEASVQAVREVVSLGLVIRAREKIGVRRPLRSLTVASADGTVRAAVARFKDTISGELNVKEVQVIEDDALLCSVKAKPNFRTLGKRLGPKLKQVQNALAALTRADMQSFEASGTLTLEGETLERDDVLWTREAVSGGAVESQNGITVRLDTQLTPELEAEGLARELINRVQNLRKTAALAVSQRIRLVLACDGALAAMLSTDHLRALIAHETLALEIERVPAQTPLTLVHQKTDLIERESIVMALEPLAT
jgi:isoleucyl-tRNA synthetase